jgi:hypothetical protein
VSSGHPPPAKLSANAAAAALAAAGSPVLGARIEA